MGTRGWVTAGLGFAAAAFAAASFLFDPPASSALFALPLSTPQVAVIASAMTFVLAAVIDYDR